MNAGVCKLSLEWHAVSSPQCGKNAKGCQEPLERCHSKSCNWSLDSTKLACTMLNSIWTQFFQISQGPKIVIPMRCRESAHLRIEGKNLRWLSQIVEVAKLISPRLLPSKKCEHFPVSFGSLESQFKDSGSSSSETPASIRHWSTLGKASNSGINGCICLIHIYIYISLSIYLSIWHRFIDELQVDHQLGC